MLVIILIASILGIIEGLFIDFNLCVVLNFFLIVLCLVLKIDKTKFLILLICSLLFNIYTSLQINKFDVKYCEGEISGCFEIISYREVTNTYDKYIAKNLSGDKFLIYIPSQKNEIKKGTMLELSGEFALPDVSRNTGGFNYRRYLNSQKIYGSVFVSKYFTIEIPKFNFFYYIQEDIYQTMSKLLPKNEMGLTLGMMIGETKDISEDIMENFKNTGITHLVAVSGSNVVYVMLLVQFIFNKLIGKRATNFVSIFFIIIFMFVSGASSSVVRASIMVIMTLIANILHLKSDTINNIAFSALLLTIINPLILYDVGFVLSFGGTIGIVLISKDFSRIFEKLFNKIFEKLGVNKFQKFLNSLVETLAVTCSAQLILTPIMLYYFNTFSLLSIVTNLIVVPFSGFITILGFVVYIISKISFAFASFFGKSLYVLTTFTIWTAEIFSKIPYSNLKIITPNLFEIIVFYFAVFVGIKNIDLKSLFKKQKYKFIGGVKKEKPFKILGIVISFFILIEIIQYNFPRNYVDIHCVDIGQGDSFYVKTPNNKNILIDGGGSENYDVGENILMPYLLDMRVNKIDTIFCSHSDADHLYGLLTVLENFKVNQIIIAKNSKGYEKLYKIAKNKNIKIFEVLRGDVIEIDKIKFEVLSPELKQNNSDVNAYALVLKMIYGNESMLFTGDITKETEENLYNVKSSILKVGHHGSKTSTSEKFLARVSPKLSIISVKKNNSYGHPNEEVLKRLKQYSKIYTTAECGEIKIKMYKNKLKISTHLSN